MDTSNWNRSLIGMKMHHLKTCYSEYSDPTHRFFLLKTHYWCVELKMITFTMTALLHQSTRNERRTCREAVKAVKKQGLLSSEDKLHETGTAVDD